MSENDTSLDVKSPRTLDSTFEIESSDEETDTLAALGEEVVSNPNLLSDESFDGSSCYSYSEDSVATASESSGEEIWDVSEEEEVTNEPNMSASVTTVVTGISFFIVFFTLSTAFLSELQTPFSDLCGHLFIFLLSSPGTMFSMR